MNGMQLTTIEQTETDNLWPLDSSRRSCVHQLERIQSVTNIFSPEQYENSHTGKRYAIDVVQQQRGGHVPRLS
jgi:hypothetical protein